MTEERLLRVFLCHSSKDDSIGRQLYHQLDNEGWMDVWFIDAKLLPSQNWTLEISNGLEIADAVIVVLSKNSNIEENTHYPNWAFASSVLHKRQNEQVFLIPLLVDDCEVPMDLSELKSIKYFPKRERKFAYQQMLARLQIYAKQLNLSLYKRSFGDIQEKSVQWTPYLWKELDTGGLENELEEPQAVSTIPVRRRWGKQLFSAINHLFAWIVIVSTLLALAACGLTVHYLVRGRNTNSITVPIISRALTLIPLPTPTLGVGSVRISPKDGMRTVYVPAGEFIMGSNNYQDDEKPVHTVYLGAFWIDQYEVTNGMYAKCVEAKVCTVPIPYFFSVTSFSSNQIPFRLWADNSTFLDQLDTDPEFFNQPVTSIFWDNANAYCHWAGRRLPTEAEWEKAARGVDAQTYPWGEKINCTKANFFSCVGNPSRIGSYEAGQSPYGAYDMAGNAMEWVADWYDSNYYQQSPHKNPLGPASGLYRAFRGGSWGSEDAAIRSTNRPGNVASIPNEFIGFRCALSE
jgi:formylglycine-generating enzyme required for sulfatase activity